MRADLFRYESLEDVEEKIGSIENGIVIDRGFKTKGAVQLNGRITFDGKLIGLVSTATGEVRSGPIANPERVGTVSPDGIVYDEQVRKLGRVFVARDPNFTEEQYQTQVYLAGGAARMTLLNYDWYLDPEVYPY